MASGLSVVVASTHGFVMVVETNIVLSLNAHKRRYDAMHVRSSPAKVRARKRLAPAMKATSAAKQKMPMRSRRDAV